MGLNLHVYGEQKTKNYIIIEQTDIEYQYFIISSLYDIPMLSVVYVGLK